MNRPSMTLEVNETIEAGQSMVMDRSTGRVSLAKMDKFGTIVGTAAEKLYKGDVITLKEGTHSVWEVKRDESGKVITQGKAVRPANKMRKEEVVNFSELNPYQTSAIISLTQELQGRLSLAAAKEKVFIKTLASYTDDTTVTEQYTKYLQTEKAIMQALRLALKGLEG